MGSTPDDVENLVKLGAVGINLGMGMWKDAKTARVTNSRNTNMYFLFEAAFDEQFGNMRRSLTTNLMQSIAFYLNRQTMATWSFAIVHIQQAMVYI